MYPGLAMCQKERKKSGPEMWWWIRGRKNEEASRGKLVLMSH